MCTSLTRLATCVSCTSGQYAAAGLGPDVVVAVLHTAGSRWAGEAEVSTCAGSWSLDGVDPALHVTDGGRRVHHAGPGCVHVLTGPSCCTT
jgi:hypothetical protein